MTVSKAEQDLLNRYDLGSNSFISEPLTVAGHMAVMMAIGHYWFQIVSLPKSVGGE